MAYHRSKLQRGFNHMIDVLGADHSGYVKRMRAAVTAIIGIVMTATNPRADQIAASRRWLRRQTLLRVTW